MRLRLSMVCQTLLLLILCLLVFGSPTTRMAYAASPLGSSQASVSLAFHAQYRIGGKAYTHSGIDLPAAAGSKIVAPCEGKVSFVGRVPSGDSAVKTSVGSRSGASEETMLAVSLKLSDGKTLTLMPFSSSSVTKGEAVAQGTALGMLAAAGDRSASSAHLHMGLKRNGVYYDPSYLLGLAVTSSAGKAAAAATPLAAQSAHPPKASAQAQEVFSASSKAKEGISASDNALGEPLAQRAGALSEAAGQSAGAAVEESSSAAGAEDAASSEESFGSISSNASAASAYKSSQAGQVGLQGIVASAGAALQARASAFMNACDSQMERLTSCLSAVGERTGISLTSLLMGVVLLVTGVMAALLYGVTMVIKRVVPLLLEKKNWVLNGLFGGDNIPKLFPAPGTTFMTRGR